MLSIQLQTDGTETLDEIDDYSQGHIKIEGRKGIISSEKAHQSMMIFLTVTDLKDNWDFAKDDLTNSMKDFASYFRLDM